jgi:hypothetical protein
MSNQLLSPSAQAPLISSIINKVKIKPIVNNITEDITDVKGKELFPNNLSNIFICARKRSGKSSLIGNILRKMADKRTTVVIFSSTNQIDPCWINIKDMLEKKGIAVISYTHFIDDETGQNLLNDFLKELETDEKEEEEQINSVNVITGDGTYLRFEPEKEQEKKHRPYVPKKSVPKYILCFDDLSSDLRHISVIKNLKSNRHRGIMNILSSQYFLDLNTGAMSNLDYMVIFKGQDTDKLEKIHKRLDLGIDFNTFKRYYEYAVKNPYCFLWIDIRNDEYRKNFNEQLK